MNIGRRFLNTRTIVSRLGTLMSSNASSSPVLDPYVGWSRQRLVERLKELEGLSGSTPGTVSSATEASSSLEPTSNFAKFSETLSFKSQSQEPKFDITKYARRKIALKFCYSGWEYCGLAFQIGPTPLPTVENVLFDALAQTRFVDKDAGFEGCGWDKCGRTDRGVSAAGQVVSLWVRSNLPSEELGIEEEAVENDTTVSSGENEEFEGLDDGFGSLELTNGPSSNTSLPKKTRADAREFDYVHVINRLLPPTIRVIAWSPVPSTFSARFSCRYRHYKYFFSSHNLDIPRMQAAATRLIGEHDFRNLCKLDVSKQITSFQRKIHEAFIEPLEQEHNESGRMYVFNLVGSAFLYHQVRHIVAILFLVGSGLEPPSIVTELMNVRAGAEPVWNEDKIAGKVAYTIMDRKPEYQMADALPLMLWDCAYDESELDWRISNLEEEDASVDGEFIPGGELVNQLQALYNRSRIYTALDQHFLKAAQKYHPTPASTHPFKNGFQDLVGRTTVARNLNIPLGGGTFLRKTKYVPLLDRKRSDPVEVANERWRIKEEARKGEKIKIKVDDGDE